VSLRVALQIDRYWKRSNMARGFLHKDVQHSDGSAETHGANTQSIAALFYVVFQPA